MFLRRDFLDAWTVAASGSTNVDPNQCGDVAVPVPCKRGVDADVTSAGESADLGRDDRPGCGLLAHRGVSGRLTVYRDRAVTSAVTAPAPSSPARQAQGASSIRLVLFRYRIAIAIIILPR